MKKIAYIPSYFKPTDDFRPILKYHRGVVYNEDIIEYIEKHSVKFHGRNGVKGRATCEMLIGFAGFAEILEVDESKTWIIKEDYLDRPYIQYVDPITDKYGHFTLVKEND